MSKVKCSYNVVEYDDNFEFEPIIQHVPKGKNIRLMSDDFSDGMFEQSLCAFIIPEWNQYDIRFITSECECFSRNPELTLKTEINRALATFSDKGMPYSFYLLKKRDVWVEFTELFEIHDKNIHSMPYSVTFTDHDTERKFFTLTLNLTCKIPQPIMQLKEYINNIAPFAHYSNAPESD